MKLEEFEGLCAEYASVFDKPFPLMMAPDMDEAAVMIIESLEEGTSAEELHPEIFKVGDDIII